jgi:hypothetical protein
MLSYKPYHNKEINILSLYNEVAVSAYLYLAFLLTDNLDSYDELAFPEKEKINIEDLRLKIAWFLASILISTIFINFVVALKNIAVSTFRYLREVRRRNYLQIRVRKA